MASGVLLSTSQALPPGSCSSRCGPHADHKRPFVVLVLGSRDVTMHVFDLAAMDALQAAVAEARDLLASAVARQDRLPAEQTAALA
jgi:hypothetical protein